MLPRCKCQHALHVLFSCTLWEKTGKISGHIFEIFSCHVCTMPNILLSLRSCHDTKIQMYLRWLLSTYYNTTNAFYQSITPHLSETKSDFLGLLLFFLVVVWSGVLMFDTCQYFPQRKKNPLWSSHLCTHNNLKANNGSKPSSERLLKVNSVLFIL